MLSRQISYFWLLCLWCTGCTADHALQPVEHYSQNMPSDFEQIAYPKDNEYTPERWALGKKLFYDTVLSLDSTVSCASCHKPDFAFGDNVALSSGIQNRLSEQNSPSLANVAYHPYFTRAGGVPTLEMQILVPIQEHNEFNFNMVLAAERLTQDSTYVAMSWRAYNRAPDAFVITRAIANFERELISKNSFFDQYYFKKIAKLSAEEHAGMELFYSEKTNCFQCHGGPDFTNYSFENNGLYLLYKDKGRKRLTGKDDDDALFKVPTLRNIAESQPYMHDGSISNLAEVVDHYNSGGKMHKNQSPLIQPLHLTPEQQVQLIAFLNTLTDEEFLTNKEHKEEK